MKYLIIILLPFILVSCGMQSSPKDEISTAKEQMKTNPDSSYKILNHVRNEISTCDEATKMDYYLTLYTSIIYSGRNVNDQSIIDIQKIIEYYKDHSTYFDNNLQLAYYLEGCIYRKEGKLQEATDTFEKSIDISFKDTNHLRILFYLLGFLLFLLALSSFYNLYMKRKLAGLKIKHANHQFDIILEKYNNAVSDLNSLKENTSEFFHNKELEVESLKDTLKSYKLNSDSNRINEQHLLQSEMIVLFHKHANKGLCLSGREWNDLETAASVCLPDFYEKLMHNGNDITIQEKKVAILTRLHFAPIEIATLMGISQQRTTNIRASINYKLFDKHSAKELSSNIEKM